MRKYLSKTMIVSALISSFLSAQTMDLKLLPTTNAIVIDVHEAVKRALSNNTDVALSEQRIQLAKSDTWLSASKLLPKISAQGNFLATHSDSVLSEKSQALLKVSLPLLDAKGLMDVRAKREHEKAALHRHAATNNEITGKVVNAYIEALIARGVMDNAELAKKTYQEELARAKRRLRVGVLRALDVTRAEYLAEKATSDYVLSVQDYNARLGELGKLMGEKESFSLAMVSFTSPYLDKSTNELMAIAEGSADLAAARRDVFAAEYETVSERLDFIPKLFASMDGSKTFPYENRVVSSPSTYAVNTMVNVEIPLFTGGARMAAIKSRRAQEAISTINLRAKEQEKLLLINGLRSQIEDFKMVKQSAELALSSATKTQQSAERLFAIGEITGLEMSEANANLFNARNEMVKTELRLEQAKLKLLVAIGKVSELF